MMQCDDKETTKLTSKEMNKNSIIDKHPDINRKHHPAYVGDFYIVTLSLVSRLQRKQQIFL